jgi:tetratricopeptide (TPR) repeat protein
MHTSSRGKVTTFYSFKGGVGRTMALANAAVLYAQRRKSVLALDFDFEAPGLHRYFLTQGESAFERYEPAGPQKGVLDFFYELRDRLRERWPGGQGFQDAETRQQLLPGIIEKLLDSGEYIYRVQLKNPNNRRAPPAILHLMAAARIDASYPEAVRSFDWQRFYDEYAEVFPVLADVLASRYDHVLVDSRTGVTDIGSICTMMLPDKLVLVFTPNDQSLQGALEAGWQSVRARKELDDSRPLPIFPLISRVENSEEYEKRKWVDKARRSFELMFRKAYQLERCELETYFNLVRIPHHSFYAYGEKIAAEEHATIETGSMAQAFSRFVECLDCESADKSQELLERTESEARTDERRKTMRTIARGLTDDSSHQQLILEHPNEPWPRLLYASFLASHNRQTEASDLFDELIQKFGESPDAQHQESVALTLYNQGVCLNALQRIDESISSYARLLRRFGDSDELPLLVLVAKALVNKGVALRSLSRHQDALAAYDEVLRRFGDSTEPPLRESVARALVNKGVALGDLNRHQDALAAYDEVLRRFGDSTEPPLREQVAGALFNKGVALDGLDRPQDALAAYDEVLRSFGDASEPSLRALVGRAFNGIGFNLLIQAKRAWQGGDAMTARSMLEKAAVQIDAARERQPNEPIVLGNAGYISFLRGMEHEARELLTKAVELGGERIIQAAMEDANIHPLPQDEAFRALLQSLSSAHQASSPGSTGP